MRCTEMENPGAGGRTGATRVNCGCFFSNINKSPKNQLLSSSGIHLGHFLGEVPHG